jgi:hypothetical protein
VKSASLLRLPLALFGWLFMGAGLVACSTAGQVPTPTPTVRTTPHYRTSRRRNADASPHRRTSRRRNANRGGGPAAS